MTRDELLSALVDDVPVHRACRQALLQGAEFVVWDDGIRAPGLFSLVGLSSSSDASGYRGDQE